MIQPDSSREVQNKVQSSSTRQRWGVILAGGDGTRLQPLTRLACGDNRPKQFCPLLGGKTLLAQTRKRIARMSHPDHDLFGSLPGAGEGRRNLNPEKAHRLIAFPARQEAQHRLRQEQDVKQIMDADRGDPDRTRLQRPDLMSEDEAPQDAGEDDQRQEDAEGHVGRDHQMVRRAGEPAPGLPEREQHDDERRGQPVERDRDRIVISPLIAGGDPGRGVECGSVDHVDPSSWPPCGIGLRVESQIAHRCNG